MNTKVKICGLSTAETMQAALDAGASHVGFIFFGKSPRNVSVEQAATLRELAQGRADVVAVTVNADNGFLDPIVREVRPDILQLHGQESIERVNEIKVRYGLPVMKAISIGEAADIAKVNDYSGVVDHLLLDAKAPKTSELPGGNGVSFDWSTLEELKGKTPFMLSGGLDADNVGAAIAEVNPWGLDLSSGVERAPGVKDTGKINALFAAIRKAQG